MIVNMTVLLEQAKKEKYAIPQFNINNLEWTKYILEECEKEKSPVILGVSESAIKHMGGYNVVTNIVTGLVQDLKITIPVVLHLDHGNIDSCKSAIDAGFTSVMIDASSYPLEDNIRITKEVVKMAKEKNISVEAEIGSIKTSDSNIVYADISEAVRLYRETNITALAPALGSVHGLYKGEPNLDFDTMESIANYNIPLVLHGGTGIEEELICKCISKGICKININTELQINWSREIRNFLNKNPDIYDPRKIIQSGEFAIKKTVCDKINLLGSKNKA